MTRLHDLNNDGEADYYEAFNYDVHTTTGFHEFPFDLQTDPQRNFYFAKAGPVRDGDNVQGGVVKMPVSFQTGVMRPRFNSLEGSCTSPVSRAGRPMRLATVRSSAFATPASR